MISARAVENLRISALLLSSEHAHLPEVSSAARSQRALNFEFFKSLEIVGFFNNLRRVKTLLLKLRIQLNRGLL